MRGRRIPRAVLLAVAAAAVAVIGLYLTTRLGDATRPQVAQLFGRPFEYTLLPASDLELAEPWDALGLSPTGDLGSVHSTLTHVEVNQTIETWNAELRGRVIGFLDHRAEGDRGVTVALPGETPFSEFYVWCFGPGSSWSDPPTPVEILTVYREWLAPFVMDLGIGTPTTFDGFPALSVRTSAGRCPTLHPTERTYVEPEPGLLTLVQVDGTPVAVVIWARTDAILDEWMPEATRFVETINFASSEEQP